MDINKKNNLQVGSSSSFNFLHCTQLCYLSNFEYLFPKEILQNENLLAKHVNDKLQMHG